MRKILTLFFVLSLASASYAQDFAAAATSFSHKKPSYITLADGTELEGTIKDIDRKKGLIEEIKIEIDGKKRKFDPAEIKFMYLPPSGISNLANALDRMYDAQKWDDDLDANKLKEGYVYFETIEVFVKKKKRTMLMQLLNPMTAQGVRVYHDPFAKETMSAGVGGITVAGGLAKSYYVKKGDAPGYRLFKKTYQEQYNELFAGCDAVLNAEDKMRWSSFEDHVNNFAACE